MSAGRVVRPRTGIAGIVLGLAGGLIKVLEYLHLIDFIHGLPHNEFVNRAIVWLLGPEGSNLVIIVGIALIVWALWRPVAPISEETRPAAPVTPLPKPAIPAT